MLSAWHVSFEQKNVPETHVVFCSISLTDTSPASILTETTYNSITSAQVVDIIRRVERLFLLTKHVVMFDMGNFRSNLGKGLLVV